jgi:hypothetical protein
VVFRLRRSLQRRWLSTAVVAGLIAAVSGLVLTLAAGAQRTASAPDAFTAAVGGEVDGTITQAFGKPRTEEVAALPGIRSLDAITFMFASVVDPTHTAASSNVAFAGSRMSTARLAAGRAVDPTNPREFVANQGFVTQHQSRLGDHYRLVSWTRDQVERGRFGVDAPAGPSVDGVLVGIVDQPETLETNYTTAIFSKALFNEVLGGETLMSVRLDPGTTLTNLRSELDGLPDGGALTLDKGSVVSPSVRNAVDTLARGIWLLAAVVAVAGVVALGQMLARHARLAETERRPLTALGSTSGELAAETLSRGVIPAIVGIAVGMVIAVLASGLFPAGFARPIEPNPGLRADFAVLAVGAASLLVGVLVWVGLALLVARRHSAGRPSFAAEKIAKKAPSPAAATGIRFALTSSERVGRSMIGRFGGIAILTAGVVGAITFAVSLDRLVTDHARFGSNFTFLASPNSAVGAADIRTALQRDPDVDGLMAISGAQVRAGEKTIGLIGVEHVKGDLAPIVLSGRLPSGPDEISLGRVTARQLHLKCGDNVALEGSAGRGSYRVVGLAIVPGLAAISGVGEGGVATAEGLLRLEQAPDQAIAVLVRPGAPPHTSERIATKVIGQPAGVEDPPASIVNVRRVRGIPGVLAAVLAALVVLTMVHALIVSIQRRRRDLAVLRALGADGRWIERAVHWQASVLIVAPLLLGVPVGLIAGAGVFRAFANRIGALPDPAVPIVLVAAVIVGLIAVANLAALLPARRARLLPAAQLLRDE